MLGFAYMIAALVFIGHADTPVARFVGLPERTVEGLLLDMVVIVLVPMAGLVWWHMSRALAKAQAIKKRFLALHDEHHLVVSVQNRQMVYKVVNRVAGEKTLEVVPVWNADGPVAPTKTYRSQTSAFAEFDPAAFLES